MTHDFDSEYIFRIVYLGDSQELEDILNSHPNLNINIQNENGESLLIHCVKRLETKWTALIGGDFRTICKTLIKRNIDVNLKDETGKTAANYAAELQQLEVLRLLIQNGANIDMGVLDSVIDKEDWILAICASLATDSENGMNNVKVNSGENVKLRLFHRLLSSNYISSIRWMCELFPEIIEMKNEESLTALHIVVIENNVDALKILLEFNAKLEAMDSKGHTALHFAVDHGNIDCMLSLLENGSAVNCQDDSGSTPLHYAINACSKYDGVNSSNDVIVDHLLKFGADTTVADGNGRLPLHWAANVGNANVCLMMVANGSPVNSRCNDGHTASLHIAASQGHAECIRTLVTKCGADVDIEDKYGYTPLYNAISTRNIHCAELLLYEDASPNHCNAHGNSPAHLAASKGISEALEVLVKYRGSLELRNNCGDLPIHEAALFLQIDAVNYILGCQSKVNVRNKQGFTPLHLAASAGSTLVCQRLLEGGADLNCINTQSKNGLYKFLTPLDLAHLNKHSQCVHYLQINGGIRGDHIVHAASKKIQGWWRQHRPPKMIPKPTKEYKTKETPVLEITERVTKDETKCVTKAEIANEERRDDQHRNDNEIFQTEKIPGENFTLLYNTENVPAEINETQERNISRLHNNELKTKSAKEAETNPIPRKQSQMTEDILHKRKSETSRVNKSAKTITGKHASCIKGPIKKSPRSQRNTTVKESRQLAVKLRTPEYNGQLSTTKIQAKKTDMQEKQKLTTSKQEEPYSVKHHLKDSLETEISRREKLSKEIARLKINLEERSLSLQKRLQVIEQNLEKL